MAYIFKAGTKVSSKFYNKKPIKTNLTFHYCSKKQAGKHKFELYNVLLVLKNIVLEQNKEEQFEDAWGELVNNL